LGGSFKLIENFASPFPSISEQGLVGFYDTSGNTTANVDDISGFSFSNIDIFGHNYNTEDVDCQAVSGLTVYGGTVYFSQSGLTAAFSGDASSFTADTTSVGGNGLTLLSGATGIFFTGQSIGVKYIVNPAPTPTPTITTSPTQTPTLTPTETPTPTPSPVPVYTHGLFSGNTDSEACTGVISTVYYSASNSLGLTSTLFEDSLLTVPTTAPWFYNQGTTTLYQMSGNTIIGTPPCPS
jgi:hypothetical protein